MNSKKITVAALVAIETSVTARDFSRKRRSHMNGS